MGDPLLVRFHASGDKTESIAVVPQGDDVDRSAITFMPRETWVDGWISIGTETLAPGPYDALLVGENGETLSRSPFWLKPVGARPELMAPSEPVTLGSSFEVTYMHAPGNRWDWLGMTPVDEKEPQNYLGFWYTDAGIDGTVTIETSELADSLTAGTYTIRLLQDDGYIILDETTVEFVNG